MAQTKVIKKKKAGIFYGWWIIIATLFIFFINSGCSSYSFRLFVSDLETAMVKEVKAGRKTPEAAEVIINPQCACGIFNPTLGAKLLKEMAGKT